VVKNFAARNRRWTGFSDQTENLGEKKTKLQSIANPFYVLILRTIYFPEKGLRFRGSLLVVVKVQRYVFFVLLSFFRNVLSYA
jgi:hypothetical protein